MRILKEGKWDPLYVGFWRCVKCGSVIETTEDDKDTLENAVRFSLFGKSLAIPCPVCEHERDLFGFPVLNPISPMEAKKAAEQAGGEDDG